MATTNLLPWNPTAANQETDPEYLADSQRTGGATNPSLFEAQLANKAFYQWSSYLYALFTAFANKGFATSDANVAALTAQCANFLTSADIKPSLLQVAYASTLMLDCSKSNGFQVTLTGNVSSLTLVNYSVNQPILLVFTQNSAGGWTVPFPSNVKSPGTVSNAANASSAQQFIVEIDNNLHPIGPMVVS